MTSVTELIDLGIRAYTRGQLGEAERYWSEALVAEPSNARARSYLDVLLGRREAAGTEPEPSGQPQPPLAADAGRRPKGAVDRQSEAEPGRAEAGRRTVEVPERLELEPSERGAAGSALPLPSPSTASRPAIAAAAPSAGAPVPLPPPAETRTAVTPQAVAAPQAAMSPQSMPRPQVAQSWGTASPAGDTPSQASERSAPEAGAASREPNAAPRSQAFPPPGQPANDRPDRSTLNDYAPSPWDEGPALTPVVIVAEGDGLDLATVADQSDLRPLVPDQEPIPRPTATPVPRNAVEVWMEGARELFALGDFSGSLEMLEKILKLDPSHGEARRYLKENESTLIAMYESKLGSRDSVPRLAIQAEEVMWLNLDHRSGFLLAQIDGAVTYEDLFALSGLPRLDTARILATLLQEGVIQSG